MSVRVVLVRPWSDARGGTGCCGGDVRDGICLERDGDQPHRHGGEEGVVALTYLRLRDALPDADVQVVGADNTAYLLPMAFRGVRERRGLRAALRAMNRATTAGSILIDGERVGDVVEMGPAAVVEEVRRRTRKVAG